MSASERRHALRLTPDHALGSLDEAAAWIEERGMATLMPCCSLPSLFAVCHEEAYAADKPGFGQWPKTRYWWPSALVQRPGIHGLKIHRGKTLLVADCVARLADPLARAALADAERGPHGRLMSHLAAAGPSLLSELKEELDLDTTALRKACDALERTGALVSRHVVIEPHRHTSELWRWDQLFPEPSPGGIDDLVLAGVEAAVVAPEGELRTWFSWPLGNAVDRLVGAGRLVRADGTVSRASGW